MASELTKNIIKVFKSEGDELVKLMQNKLDVTNSNASGKLKKSIKKDVFTTKEFSGATLEVSGNDYGFFKDEGRKAGKFPPQDAIRKWIKQKGITPKEGMTSKTLIFLIQRKIGTQGFKGINFIKESLQERINKIIDNLAIATRKDVELDVQRFTKKDFFITK